MKRFGINLSILSLFWIFFSVINTFHSKATAPTVLSTTSIGYQYFDGGSYNVTFNKPTGVQNGDLLLAYFNFTNNYAGCSSYYPGSWPGGWGPIINESSLEEWVGSAEYGTPFVAFKYISHASSEASSYSFPISGADDNSITGAMIHVRGAKVKSSYGYRGGLYNGNAFLSTISMPVPPVNAQGDSLWIISGFGRSYMGGRNPSATPAGFTNLLNENDDVTAHLSTMIDYKVVSSGNTGSVSYPYTAEGGAYPNDGSFLGSIAGTGIWVTSLAILGCTAPYVVSYYPVNDGTYVPRTTSLILTFNENIFKGTGNIYIKRYSNDQTLLTIPVSDNMVSVSGNEVRIRLRSCFASGERIYILIDSGAFVNSCGTAYTGISSKTTWYVKMSNCNMLYNEI